MNFEKLLATFDMGVCADQVQREAVFELVLFFAAIDGVEAPEEENFIRQWIDASPWSSGVSKHDYRIIARNRVFKALETEDFEGFIKQRALSLNNCPSKNDTLDLLERLVAIDGYVHQLERQSLDYLKKLLN